jgi:hypothetical protein
MPYGEYLLTPEWRRTRDRALVRASWTCQRCSSKRFLQVHHRTYERLGAELPNDLEVVCADCHEGEHVALLDASDARVYLKLAREVLRDNPFGSIGELADQTKQLCATRRVPYDGPTINRAIGLVTGTRIVRPARRSVVGWLPADRRVISGQEAHELLRRLLRDIPTQRVVKAMPAPPGSDMAHERRVREQVPQLRAYEPPPTYEQLYGAAGLKHDRDAVRRSFDHQECEEFIQRWTGDAE